MASAPYGCVFLPSLDIVCLRRWSLMGTVSIRHISEAVRTGLGTVGSPMLPTPAEPTGHDVVPELITDVIGQPIEHRRVAV